MTVVVLLVSGLAVVAATRLLLYRGIERAGELAGLSPKAQGQILGYSTSVPELVGTVSTAAMGLIGAGLWNVAASNIINLVLFLSASFFYRQSRELLNRNFLDEAGFSVGAILIPILLVAGGGMGRSIWTAAGLFGYFALYIVVDRWLDRGTGTGTATGTAKGTGTGPGSAPDAGSAPAAGPAGGAERSGPAPAAEPSEAEQESSTQGRGRSVLWAVGMILAGLLVIVVAGRFLGSAAEGVVKRMGLSEMAVGWILGVLTSLPELTSFFSIYASSREKGRLHEVEDTQEALDNLAASNMSNLGVIYPLGILVYLALGFA
jgi:Ca2+/Na+ antiporter